MTRFKEESLCAKVGKGLNVKGKSAKKGARAPRRSSVTKRQGNREKFVFYSGTRGEEAH